MEGRVKRKVKGERRKVKGKRRKVLVTCLP
jgi:hypothetical protein